MKYRNLGNSGLKISELSFGSWVTFVNQLKEKEAMECMSYAYERGVNFFDNAEAYASGESEVLMGNIFNKLRWDRDTYIVSSKVFWGGELPTQRGLSKKHIHDACNAALKRLRVDYLDLFFCHRPDPETPIGETVYAMNDLMLQGKILYWGTSEWSSKEIKEAFKYAEKFNLRGPSMEQPQYNLLFRDRFEKEYKNIFKKYKIGSTIWSPLASGLLTGKYNEGVPNKSRFKVKGYEWLSDTMDEIDFNKIKKINNLAKKIGIKSSQLAIIWCLKNINVSSVILGASKLSQLKENLNSLKSYDLITDEIMNEINKY
ncbi:MAG: aldo/keto reductase [Candidatus Marinimicrobia bacterium]|nr:aldo/keto reductase [Candidatus Neomarinimicrobiota bacterium]|tara:strand:+ start:7544 stop:8488 length:945 start_codon:yes stop_codon:yes gene_type:complete